MVHLVLEVNCKIYEIDDNCKINKRLIDKVDKEDEIDKFDTIYEFDKVDKTDKIDEIDKLGEIDKID